MEKAKLIENLLRLPRPLCGSITHDTREIFNLRDVCIDMLKEVIKISNPKEILEIGCHAMFSSMLLLEFSKANLTSIDIGENWITWEHGFLDWGIPSKGGGLKDAKKVIDELFPGRFRFVKGDSTLSETINQFNDRQYDLIFIDGNHDYEYVKKDIKTAINLKIPYILLDDYSERDGDLDDRIRAARDMELVKVKIYPDIHNAADIGCALFKNPKL